MNKEIFYGILTFFMYNNTFLAILISLTIFWQLASTNHLRGMLPSIILTIWQDRSAIAFTLMILCNNKKLSEIVKEDT